jgi:hypothetical protein
MMDESLHRPSSPSGSVVSTASTVSALPSKVPTVIANKSKSDLEIYVLELLKKLKQRDKRIEGSFLRMHVIQV